MSDAIIQYKRIIPGPGENILLFGGLVMVKDLLSRDKVASINTSFCPAWKACEENPRSINATTKSSF